VTITDDDTPNGPAFSGSYYGPNVSVSQNAVVGNDNIADAASGVAQCTAYFSWNADMSSPFYSIGNDTGDDWGGNDTFVCPCDVGGGNDFGSHAEATLYWRIVASDSDIDIAETAGPLYVFDPRLPWTVYKGGPPGHPAPDRTDPASNPRELGSFGGDTRVAIAHSSALGADGKLYFGGFGERNYTGGGFGWYDPKTGQFGGFWKPLSGYAVQWLAPALDGRLIVISTSRAGVPCTHWPARDKSACEGRPAERMAPKSTRSAAGGWRLSTGQPTGSPGSLTCVRVKAGFGIEKTKATSPGWMMAGLAGFAG